MYIYIYIYFGCRFPLTKYEKAQRSRKGSMCLENNSPNLKMDLSHKTEIRCIQMEILNISQIVRDIQYNT